VVETLSVTPPDWPTHTASGHLPRTIRQLPSRRLAYSTPTCPARPSLNHSLHPQEGPGHELDLLRWRSRFHGQSTDTIPAGQRGGFITQVKKIRLGRLSLSLSSSIFTDEDNAVARSLKYSRRRPTRQAAVSSIPYSARCRQQLTVVFPTIAPAVMVQRYHTRSFTRARRVSFRDKPTRSSRCSRTLCLGVEGGA
jgi:hypothetical protein